MYIWIELFIYTDTVARSDALIINKNGVQIHITFWGEQAGQIHEGLEKQEVSIGPLKVVRFESQFNHIITEPSSVQHPS